MKQLKVSKYNDIKGIKKEATAWAERKYKEIMFLFLMNNVRQNKRMRLLISTINHKIIKSSRNRDPHDGDVNNSRIKLKWKVLE